MGRLLLAGAAALMLAGSAYAASAKFYIVVDTVSNCAVVDSKPAEHAGMKVIGDKGGYSSKDAAKKALADLKGKCKGIVE